MTRSIDVPNTVNFPGMPFWPWPTGFHQISIRITFHQALVMVFQAELLVGSGAGEPSSANFALEVELNGTPIFMGGITTSTAQTSFQIPGPTTIYQNNFYLYNDRRPNAQTSAPGQYPGVDGQTEGVIPASTFIHGGLNTVKVTGTYTVGFTSSGSSGITADLNYFQIWKARRFSPIAGNKWRWSNDANVGGMSMTAGKQDSTGITYSPPGGVQQNQTTWQDN